MEPYLVSFKALADPTRLRIAAVLQSGAFNVNELVSILGLGQSRVSRHLRILVEAGLLEAKRDGVWVYYRLSERWQQRGDSPLRYLRVLGHELQTNLNGERDAVEACLARRREQSSRFFRKVADQWDRRRDAVQGPSGYLEQLLERIDPVTTLVDLGTGTGVLLPHLSARAEKVIGIDASPEMLRVAGSNCVASELTNVELRLGTLEHLPLANEMADMMVAHMVLHHVANPPDALKEARRALRSGGALVVADFARHSVEDYREKLGDLWLGFEGAELESWLDTSGFALEELKTIETTAQQPSVVIAHARALNV